MLNMLQARQKLEQLAQDEEEASRKQGKDTEMLAVASHALAGLPPDVLEQTITEVCGQVCLSGMMCCGCL
jgi:hypothetical protein